MNKNQLEAMIDGPEAVRTYIEGKISAALQRVDEAAKMFPPKMLLGLMSGGNDSVPACFIASLHSAFSGVLHINTETGLAETREHVYKVCAQKKWPIFERKPSEYVNAKGILEPISYKQMVLAHGFPGAAQHSIMYNMLKERQLLCFEREMGFEAYQGELVIYISGVRQQESARRQQTVVDMIKRVGRRVWVSPIWDWDRLDCKLVREYAGIPENPVSKKIGMSGECLCGAHAKPGELATLAQHYPNKADEIKAFQVEVKAAGKPWGWEGSPPRWYTDLVQAVKAEWDVKREAEAEDADQILCASCNKLGRLTEDEMSDPMF